MLAVNPRWMLLKDVPRKYCPWPDCPHQITVQSCLLLLTAFPSLSLSLHFFCLLPYFQLPASQIIKCQSSDTWHFNECSVFTTQSLSTALPLSMRAGSALLCWTEALLCCRAGPTEERWTRAAAQNWEEGMSRFPNLSPCHFSEFMSSVQLNKHLLRPSPSVLSSLLGHF